MAEELREPRHLPRIIMVSISTCAALYIIICICYDAVLPGAAIAASSTVALDVVRATLGTWGVAVAGLLVSASVLGSMNVSLMTGGRLFYSAARSGELPAPLGTLSKTNRTPVWALLAQATAVLALLAMPGSSFNGLVAYFGSASWLWYGVTGGSLLRLRSSMPSAHRPFRCPIPCAVLVIALAAYLIASSVVDASTRSHTLVSLAFPVAAFTCHALYTAVTRSLRPTEDF
jgi:amino acid transporter